MCCINIINRHASAGRWTLGVGLWTLDYGRWTLDAGRWTLDYRPWTLDATLWTVGSGHSILSLFVLEQNQNLFFNST